MVWRVRTDPWPTVFEVDDPEVVESALLGTLLVGDYRREGEDWWQTDGAFRLDRLVLLEPASQMQLERAA